MICDTYRYTICLSQLFIFMFSCFIFELRECLIAFRCTERRHRHILRHFFQILSRFNNSACFYPSMVKKPASLCVIRSAVGPLSARPLHGVTKRGRRPAVKTHTEEVFLFFLTPWKHLKQKLHERSLCEGCCRSVSAGLPPGPIQASLSLQNTNFSPPEDGARAVTMAT